MNEIQSELDELYRKKSEIEREIQIKSLQLWKPCISGLLQISENDERWNNIYYCNICKKSDNPTYIIEYQHCYSSDNNTTLSTMLQLTIQMKDNKIDKISTTSSLVQILMIADQPWIVEKHKSMMHLPTAEHRNWALREAKKSKVGEWIIILFVEAMRQYPEETNSLFNHWIRTGMINSMVKPFST